MLRILAGDLSASFLLDGSHRTRYIARGPEIAQKICEQLILHEQVLIPTTDYLAATGLIEILGEDVFLDIMEADQLRFVRLRKQFAYTRNLNRNGDLVVLSDPEEKQPFDSSTESAIQIALSKVRCTLHNKAKIAELLIKQSVDIELAPIINSVRDQSYADLRKSKYWHSSYVNPNNGGVRLPGIEKGQIKLLGLGTDPISGPIDALLALTLANVELFLAKRFDCVSTSTGAPTGDSISLKLTKHQKNSHGNGDALWSFLEFEKLPNLAIAALEQPERFKELLKLTRSKNCEVFRQWFSEKSALSEKDMVASYIELLHHVPWVKSAPVKVMRVAVASGLGLLALGHGIPLVGDVLGALDATYTEKFLKGSSAKYFVDDLKNFSGRILLRE